MWRMLDLPKSLQAPTYSSWSVDGTVGPVVTVITTARTSFGQLVTGVSLPNIERQLGGDLG